MDQLGPAEGGLRESGHADAHRDPPHGIEGRGADRRPHPLGHLARFFLLRLGEDDGELLAAVARHHVGRPHRGADGGRQCLSTSSPFGCPKVSLIS